MSVATNSMKSIDELSLSTIREEILGLIQVAALDHRVLSTLRSGGTLLARESALWDYKSAVGREAHERCELIKDIVAFHNSYGGYLLLGVAEGSDEVPPALVGVESNTIDESQLRAQIRTYTGASIELCYRELTLSELPPDRRLGLLFVPRRKECDSPIVMQKNAAQAPNGKQAFKEGQILLRAADESRPVRERADLAFLLSKRILQERSGPSGDSDVGTLQNNLPAKHIICPQFVGREELLDRLWQWLADPFAHVHVLAGDGGKGKTSIAYAFASEFAARHPAGFEHVVWLSAKQKQFAPLANEYVEMPEYHFEDTNSLLIALASRCGVREEDLTGATTPRLKGLCKEALAILPALVIVDDIDSLDLNEQKRVMETANQVASTRSRFLLTTRTNLTYSSDICTTVPGFPLDEYAEFVGTLCWRLKIGTMSKSDIERLHAATDGSPLLTESIVRLVRQGMAPSAAIDEWKGQAGQDARNAALDKEIQRLSVEARRVLLCMSYLGECSLAEVRHLTNYGQVKVRDAIDELQSLFLVSAPVLTESEPRFAVPPLVRFLSQEKRKELAVDYQTLLIEAKKLRKGKSLGQQGNVRLVGAAIAQAAAQMAQEEFGEAISTLESALKRQPGQPNLLCMLARCYMKGPAPRLNEARDYLKKAYDGGNRRPEVYEGWYEAECAAGHWPGALHVANLVLKDDADDANWRYRRAYVHSQIAAVRERSGDAQVANLYEQAAEDLAVSISNSRGVYRQERVAEARALNDLLWSRSLRSSHGRQREVFETVRRGILRGDYRSVMYERLYDALRLHLENSEPFQPDSEADLAARTLLLHAEEALGKRPNPDESFRAEFDRRLGAMDALYRAKLRSSRRS